MAYYVAAEAVANALKHAERGRDFHVVVADAVSAARRSGRGRDWRVVVIASYRDGGGWLVDSAPGTGTNGC